MAADAIFAIALGTLLVFGLALTGAIVLARRALRERCEFEVEIKAPSLSFRIRVKS